MSPLFLLEAIRESGAFAELSILPEFGTTLTELCIKLSLVGNELNDAYLAAVAMDARLRLVSTHDGFRRFRGLNWVNPLRTEWS